MDNTQHIKHTNVRSKKSRVKSKKRSKLSIKKIILFILIILCIILFNKKILKPRKIIGTWNLDGITKYEFYSNKTGKLILPATQYTFKYKIKDNKLYIDFENDNLKDCNYEYTIKDKTLNIKGINGSIGEFSLHKE